jgi:release factor glutamine methyltransferase
VHAPDNPPVPPPQGDAPGTLGDWLNWATGALQDCADSPKLDAEVLLCELLGCNRAGLVLRAGDPVRTELALRYAALIDRRRLGEPVAYLTGRREFWSLSLDVSPAVLIPRPDTELLVEWALQRLRDVKVPVVADLGTGSGAIALAIASERPDARVIATDQSRDALSQARHNAQRLGLERVEFRQGDWLAPLGESFDLIVSNPPYIAENDPHLASLRYEPRRALTSGPDGLADLRRIAAEARAYLWHRSVLLMEHGAEQGAAVRALLQEFGYVQIETRRDLNGHERATLGVHD